MTQTDLAEQVDMSIDTVRAVERATRSIRPSNLARFEKALRWPSGTCQEILNGKDVDTDAIPVDEPAPSRTPREIALDELDNALIALIIAWGAREVAASLARVLGHMKYEHVNA